MLQDKPLHHNVNAARLLLEHYGYDTLSYFSLHDKKKYFFSSTGSSFLSYIIKQNIVLVSGDPIGPSEEIQMLLKEFQFFVKGAGMTTCFVGIHENSLPFLKRIHHNILHVGDEAIVSLSTYNKQCLKKKVRRAEKHITNLGITCNIFTRQELPASYLKQIKAISHEWLKGKGGKERGFSMTLGRVPDASDTHCEFVVALKGKTVLAYLTFVPVYASQALSLDASRKKTATPNGLLEYLLLQAFDYYKTKDIKQISLNFAAFYKHTLADQTGSQKNFKSLVYKGLSIIYRTNTLYNFNKKFMPEWQSRYIAFEKKRYIPRYLFTVAKMELNL